PHAPSHLRPRRPKQYSRWSKRVDCGAEWRAFLASDGGSKARADHALDEKGRVVVPARLREQLGERFTVTVNPADRCVAVYSQANWEVFCRKLDAAPRTPEQRRFERFLAEHTVEGAGCDSQGRLLLAQSQREFAGIERETVIVAPRRYVEIWAKERYPDNVMNDEQAGAHFDKLEL
ncbi:MAG: division/cell wall cluster transcriptional repressor MraZ, partial [Vulcanimicrobiaceae bacterium]